MPRRSMRRFPLLAILVSAAAFLVPAPARAAISGYLAFPVYISPNGDGVNDRVRLTWTLSDAAADVLLRITNLLGDTLVKRVDLGARPAGPDSTFWDGRDSTATVVRDGAYLVQLVETPVSGSSSPGLARVNVDDTPPPVPDLQAPVDTTQTDSTYDVHGTAAGADSVLIFHDGVLAATVPSPDLGGTPVFDFKELVLHQGPNQIAVQGKDLAGNFSPLGTPVNVTWLNAPDLLLLRATPAAFSPNGDGIRDSTVIRVLLDAPTTRLVVELRKGTVPSVATPDRTTLVKRLYDAPAPADTLTFVWDGRDSLGNVVPDGFYAVRESLTSFTANGTPFDTQPIYAPQLTVDTVPPGTPVATPPIPASTFQNHLPFTVISTGAESLLVLPDGPRVVRPLLGGQAFELDLPLTLGPNTFALQGVDLAGNLSPVAGPYTVEYRTPIGFHANERFRPNDAFVVNLDRAANAVDVAIYSLRGRLVRHLSARTVELHFEIPWDGKDDLGDFVGDGPYVARAVVDFVDGTRSETKGAVVLVK